jgi:5'-methylthioadenosine phosphorylase
VAAAIIGKLHAAVESGTIISDVEGSMQYAIITQPPHQKVEDRQKLSYILPYFKE